MTIQFEPIGVIHSPFKELEGMPIQPKGAAGVKGTVEVYEPYRQGLDDLDGFSHIYLIYHFHLSQGYKLHIIPFMDDVERGLFSTRAPKRPNSIGFSIVALDSVADGILHIRNVDVLDGTPLLDIKPFAPQFDAQENVRTGWLEKAGRSVSGKRSDDRFK
ncbi:MAG: tRNA (N6-threonylcarbamoyladenosine(37)-N6)-methyltransferase TrmO [Desulfobacterales bacterium]|nr:tRNA (N6-threonylcarbamoyladenosine(37)-N6)-methyltransferase TrmO [Desulfobacterales bacterium]